VPSAETAYLFRHALMREAARGLHLPSDRARLHGLALDVLEALPGVSQPALAHELADHALSARDMELSPAREHELCRAEIRHLRTAADSAERNWHIAEAVSLLHRLGAVPHITPAESILALVQRGRLFRISGSAAQATDLLREALANPNLPDEMRGNVQCELGSALGNLGFLEPGVRMLQQGLSAPAGTLDARVRCRSLRSLAIYLTQIGRIDDGLKATHELEVAARDAHDPAMLGDALQQRMLAHETRGEMEQAFALEPEIWRCFEQAGNVGAAVPTLVNLGTFHYRRGNLDRAETLYLRARVDAAATGQLPQEAGAIVNLAVIMLARQRYDEAAPLLVQAVALGKELGQLRIEQGALANLAVLYGQTGRFEEAERTLRRALDLARRMGDKVQVTRILSNLAAATDELKRPQDSIVLRREACDILLQANLGDTMEAFSAWGNRALCAHKLGLTAEAMDARARSRELATRHGLLPGQGLQNTRELLASLEKLDAELGP